MTTVTLTYDPKSEQLDCSVDSTFLGFIKLDYKVAYEDYCAETISIGYTKHYLNTNKTESTILVEKGSILHSETGYLFSKNMPQEEEPYILTTWFRDSEVAHTSKFHISRLTVSEETNEN